MNILSFISSVVTALAWPAAIVVVACVLRSPVRDLLRLLTKLKYGDLELSFDRKIEKLEHRAHEALPLTELHSTQQKPLLSPEIAALAETSPRAAIIEAWVQLSNTALRALKRKGVSIPQGGSSVPVVPLLHSWKSAPEMKLVVIGHECNNGTTGTDLPS